MGDVIRLRAVWPAPADRGSAMPLIVQAHLTWMRHRGLAVSTADKRRRVLARLGQYLRTPACEATAAQLAEWRASLTYGDSAIAADLSHVREFFRWLQDEGLRDDNPAARLVLPRLGRRLPRPISEQDLLHALAAAPGRIRPWLVLAGWAGLRAKEIALLRRECVLEMARPAPLILVAKDATKGSRERLVPMSPFVAGELVPVLPRSGWVFRRRDGQPGPNLPGQISHLANRHLHDCGVAATLHQLRHRFGTGTYQVTRDLRVVQELLGHALVSTTAGYAAYSNASAIEAVENLPAPGHLHLVAESE